MDNKHRRILIVIWVLTLIVLLTGTTYAYFSSVSTSNIQVITTQSTSMNITYKGSTHVSNINPTDWPDSFKDVSSNENIAKLPFSITSSSTAETSYTINLKTFIKENDNYTGGSANDIKYAVYKGNEEVSSGGLYEGDVNIKIIEGKSKAGETLNDDYILYIYIENKNEAQNRLQNLNFNVRLVGTIIQM